MNTAVESYRPSILLMHLLTYWIIQLTTKPHQKGESAAPKLVDVKTMKERTMIGKATMVWRIPRMLRRDRQCPLLLSRRHILPRSIATTLFAHTR